MKRFIPALLFLASCFSRSAVMTRQDYNDVQIGQPMNQYEERIGKPYKIRPLKDGNKEYEYIERIFMGDEVIEENHYFLVVNPHGQIEAKRTSQETPPAYDLIDDPDPNDTDLQ